MRSPQQALQLLSQLADPGQQLLRKRHPGQPLQALKVVAQRGRLTGQNDQAFEQVLHALLGQKAPGADAQLAFTLRREAAFEDQQQVEVGIRASLAAAPWVEECPWRDFKRVCRIIPDPLPC